MELNIFVKNVLVDISKGIKGVNVEMDRESSEPLFALKNSGWFVDKIDGCVRFDILVKNKKNVIEVVDQKLESLNNSHRIKFNVVQVGTVS